MPRLEGSMVAIVTPMKDGAVDLRALRELTEWQVAEGTDGIVPCGTTGEGVTLTAAERAEVIRTVVQTVRGRAAVIAGAGSNATHEAIESVKVARELGADAALVVTPYYNKPTQEGLFRHYQAIWEAARFPVVAYNVPSRTSVDLLPETVARLAKAGAIVGIKEATASMDRQVQLVEKVGQGRHRLPLRRRLHRAALHRLRRPRRHLGHRQHRAPGHEGAGGGGAERATSPARSRSRWPWPS